MHPLAAGGAEEGYLSIGNALVADWAGVGKGGTRIRTLAREQKKEEK